MRSKRLVLSTPLASSKEAPSRFRIFTHGWNEFEIGNGSGEAEEILVDQQGAEEVLSRFAAYGNRLVIDYEHQSLSEDKAPAAGWITALEWVAMDGLYVDVEWTDEAKEFIESKQYLYFSPVVWTDESNRITELDSLALTNRPRTRKLMPLVASKNSKDSNMELTDLGLGDTLEVVLSAINNENSFAVADFLGLPTDLSLDELKKRVSKCFKPHSEEALVEQLCKDLNLEVTQEYNQLLSNIQLRLSNPPGFVKADEYNALSKQFEELQERARAAEASAADEKAKMQDEVKRYKFNELIASKEHAGKITPNQREWAWSTYQTNSKFFEEWLASAPVRAPQTNLFVASKSTDTQPGRESVIARACAEWKDKPESKRKLLGSIGAWVNEALKESGMDKLSTDERKQLTN